LVALIGLLAGSGSRHALALQAEEVSFTATAKAQVVVGEQFRVVFTVNSEGKDFRGPDFKGFSVLSGPNTSSSFSTQIINGQIARSVSYSYTYYLLADQEGRYTIGPATIIVNGQQYTSNGLTINVIKGQTAPKASPGSQQRPSRSGQEPSSGQSLGKDDVFLRVSTDNQSPWMGEQVILTYKIYTRRQISLPSAMVQPSLPGFWTEDLLKDEKQYRQTEETINGSKYVVVEFKRIAAFPQKTGELSIPAFEVEVAARVQSQRRTGDPFFDNFFGGSFFNTYQDIPVTLRSQPLTLKVRALPLTGRPAGFSGAVGSFTFSGEVDRTQLSTNDALTIKYVLSGTGNLMMAEAPEVGFPSDFEVYDPRVSDRFTANRSGLSGSRSFEYIAIPRVPGSFGIKEMTFSYFDPSSDRYKTIRVPAFALEVVRGEGEQGNGTISAVSQEDVKFIGSDIRFLKTGDAGLRMQGASFFLSPGFILLAILPLLLFGLSLVFWKRRTDYLSDYGAVRRRRATRLARKHLRTAYSRLKSGNGEGYYEAISQAIWGYLGDRFNLPLASLTLDNAEEKLRNHQVNEPSVEELKALIGDAEFARFAPPEGREARKDMYARAMEVITRIENEMKK